MKYAFIGTLIGSFMIIALSVALPVETRPQPANASQPSQCPAGSYDIGISKDGQPICKLEPTGCPYGDSIPMDMCNKFKPAEPVQPAPTPPEPQTLDECGGK